MAVDSTHTDRPDPKIGAKPRMDIFVVLILRRDGHVHPGMDAALIAYSFARFQSRSGAATGGMKMLSELGA